MDYRVLAKEIETEHSKFWGLYGLLLAMHVHIVVYVRVLITMTISVIDIHLYPSGYESHMILSMPKIPLPGIPIQLQGTLLDPEKQSLRPDEQFLELLAGVVRSECPSLASILSLTSNEMEEVEKNRKQLSQSELSLQMLKKWATREEATYGQLIVPQTQDYCTVLNQSYPNKLYYVALISISVLITNFE